MTGPTTPADAPILALVEQAGKAVAVIASLLLVVSVFFDYSFLLALGLSFDELPSSLSEHVRSAILWAPKLLLTGLAFLMYELFLRRVEGGKTEAELIASSPTPRFTRAFRKSGDLIVPISGTLGALFMPFLSSDFSWAYLLFAVLWGFLSLSVVHHPRLGAPLSGLRGRLFIVLPMILSIVGLHGYQSGARMLSSAAPKWEIVLREGSTVAKHNLLGIRRFGSFAIVVDQSRLVSVVPNDAIVSVKNLVPRMQTELNACRWFGVLCQPAPSSNPTVPGALHDKAAQRPGPPG
jgi:hypothetical protein